VDRRGERPLIDVSNLDTRPWAGLESFLAGIEWAGPDQAPTSVYFDEVVFDAVPVPCDDA
jgi:hypothetical protein